ncbi:hypothetical protein LJY25_12885 [Hymenobacter sp. BT175]|uniref:DUF6992 family protein n=1 Tax=Hymenobacter translucens TaxID=2886507 RepID=UPI001D0E498E|nr:hypothetical protein [Hymenobacter translucens]MCC2547343.1 hypothetical protein [Hymenobacter translucens]
MALLCLLLTLLPAPLARLPAINHSRELLAEQGMAVLGAWALLNLLVSGYYVAQSDSRTEGRWFHLMNVSWNVVNAVLAVVGMLRAHPGDVASLTLAASLAAQFDFEKILLLNAGLDVAYIAVGSWLRAGAPRHAKPVRQLGFGRSLWVQGSFLLLFDLGFYFVYHRHAAELLALVG